MDPIKIVDQPPILDAALGNLVSQFEQCGPWPSEGECWPLEVQQQVWALRANAAFSILGESLANLPGHVRNPAIFNIEAVMVALKEHSDDYQESAASRAASGNYIDPQGNPTPPSAPAPPPATVHGRLGVALGWLGNIAALGAFILFVVVAVNLGPNSHDQPAMLVMGTVLAVAFWGAGRALKYVLAGR